MGMQPATHKRLHECDGCGWEVSGYSKSDLEKDGWTFHRLNVTRDFVLCGECTAKYETAWNAKATA